ncbi:MAG: hypothetical protein CME70_20010 [Halobacteriovorax sp.]|nr:hypothetical protein [Halobacteriovorax sp.]|tara:strand:+ start:69706 stop:70815 length:1110 start_codon:yes stop_codon:yes gene_type:complete
MNHTDCNFPIIAYEKDKSPRQWGQYHGEAFKTAIKELYEIRIELMLAKNPALKNYITPLANEQLEASRKFAPLITEELEGIAEGAGLTTEQIVILNNYTDFRDIEMPEEGCSTVHVSLDGEVYSGQTWDMHSSAKNYVSIIKTPEAHGFPASVIFSLVGCVGMMGVNSHKALIGVNNINTSNARAGLIWPVLVRKCLQSKNLASMRDVLVNSPVTSGHNYIISDPTGGEHWEITPIKQEMVGAVGANENGGVFHTNHCLGKEIKKLEDQTSASSTTHARWDLLTKKVPNVKSYDDLKSLLQDHDGHPKSICSHFESGAQDPSMTCGGGIAHLTSNDLYFWRGCPVHDSNFVEYSFKLESQGESLDFRKI